MKTRVTVGVLAVVGLTSATLISACTKDHAPFIDTTPVLVRPPGGGDGGTGGGEPTATDGGSPDAGNNGIGNAGTEAVSGAGPGPTLGLVDPSEIYIYGTLAEGSAGRDALAHWSTPNLYTVGFDSYTDDQSVRIWKGQLVYQIVFAQGIRIFQPEFQTSLKPVDLKYPLDPARNDPIVATPPCLAEDTGPERFLTSPDDRLIYQCPDKIWYEGGKQVFKSTDVIETRPVALGYSGLALTTGISDFAVMNLADGQPHTVDGLTGVLAYRASKDGFHMVLQSKTGNDTPELWLVTPDGGASRIGTYGFPPEGVQLGHAVLSGKDELFQQGYQMTDDVIVARDTSGKSQVVYTEATNPRLKMHGSTIFTGP